MSAGPRFCPFLVAEDHRGNVCPARTRCTTSVLSILALAPSLSSPREVPQVDRNGLPTFKVHKPGGMATSPLPSRGCSHGDKIGPGYITPAFRESPIKEDRIRSGYISPAFLGAQKWADWRYNPCLFAGPQ